jgi:hypothetical protein
MLIVSFRAKLLQSLSYLIKRRQSSSRFDMPNSEKVEYDLVDL